MNGVSGNPVSTLTGCDDVYLTKLLQEKNEVTMHQLYSSVGVALMQQYGALQKKYLELTQVRSVARMLLPLTGDGQHCILQDMKRKCYHFYQVQVLKMYKNMSFLWCRMNPGQFKLTPCGAQKHKKKYSSTELQNRAPFNFQEGKRPLCVPLFIASELKTG
jgi:hypothetical protein